MSITIYINVELDDQFVMDVLTTALESGWASIGYWAIASEVKRTKELDVTSFRIGLREAVGDETLDDRMYGGKTEEVGTEQIKIGMQKLIDGTVPLGARVRGYIVNAVLEGDAGHIDADAADAIVQAGLLGEIIFG